MKHKKIIEAHRMAVADAQGKREETGRSIMIIIDLAPVITWQERLVMGRGVKKIETDAPPSSPIERNIEVKPSGGCCVVM